MAHIQHLISSNQKTHFTEYLVIIGLGLLLFVPFIGAAHLFDWDEANFGEAAREMVITGQWLNPQIDYQLFWEKPPIFIWMQAISMEIFGINEFAARFPNSIIGVITLCLLFAIGNMVANKRIAWIWVFLYIGTWLTHLYFKSAIIDPTFNLFIFLSFYFLYKSIETKKITPSIMTGVMVGLGVLTKGPVAALIIGLCGLVYVIIKKRINIMTFMQYTCIVVATFITVMLWLGIDIVKNGLWFTETFLVYQYRLFSTQDAGHGGPWFYHPLVLIIGCFPASILFLNAVLRKKYWSGEDNKNNFYLLMTLMFFVHLILFSYVKTKIIHYSSLCYFPLTFWAAVEMDRLLSSEGQLKKVFKIIGIVVGTLIGLLIAALPIVVPMKDNFIHLIKDKFTKGNFQAEVPFSPLEAIIGVMIIAASIIIIVSIYRKKVTIMYFALAIQGIMISTTIAHYAPKVEAFSQGGAISFYKKAKADNKYVYTYMMKSYAYLFYSEKTPVHDPNFPKNIQEVFEKTAYQNQFYIVSKNIHKDRILKENPALYIVEERAGYVLYAFTQ